MSKSGIPYFPLDVSLDDNFKLIEAEFGITGFAVVVKLFQKIYGGQGYYCEWTNEVALLFGRELGLGSNVVSEIVSASIKRGIFNKSQYEENSILTSKGIQKRYLDAVARRNKIEIEKRYLLINDTILSKNVYIIKENVNILIENADSFKQSKEEYSNISSSQKSKKTFGEDEECYYLATELKRLINTKSPSAKTPDDLQEWAKHFDLLLRVDKKSGEQIWDVMDWATSDSFWSTNILSANTLRKQYDKLYLQMKKRG